MKIFVVVPTFNEEKNIQDVLDNLKKNNYNNIIIIDDASQDETVKLARIAGVKILEHKINRGQGAALQTGTDYAVKNNADIIVHFDGDGQFLAEEIKFLVEPIMYEKIDIILGSRFLKKNKNIPKLKKYIIYPVSKIINTFFTGIKLTDVHCGFRALSKKAAEKININQDGMSHNTEIISQIKKFKLKYREVPVTVIYKEFGQGIKGGLNILKELFFGKFL